MEAAIKESQPAAAELIAAIKAYFEAKDRHMDAIVSPRKGRKAREAEALPAFLAAKTRLQELAGVPKGKWG